MPIRKATTKRLGEILIERGSISKLQLDNALQLQKQQGGLIGQTLVKLGYVSEEEIVTALADQFGCPYLPLSSCEIDPELIKLVPENVARQYYAIPIDKIGKVLTVVVADPTNTLAIKDLEYITKCKIQVFVGTATEIRETINHYYKSEKSLGMEGTPADHLAKVDFRRAAQEGKRKTEEDKKEEKAEDDKAS